MRRINPPLEFIFRYFCNGHDSTFPTLFIIGKVSCTGFFQRTEPIHNLTFIERTVFIGLVHNKHVAFCRVIRQEHINMVTVHSFGTTDITIIIVHGDAPFLAVLIGTGTYTTFRVFDSNIVTVNLYMTFLVVACFLLCFGRIPVYFCTGFLNLRSYFTSG